MRLGCETVAADLNPVAWFILRCTLHYPRALAGQEAAVAGVRRGRSRVRRVVSESAGNSPDRRAAGSVGAAGAWRRRARYRWRPCPMGSPRPRTRTPRGICAPGDGRCWGRRGASWRPAIRPTRSSNRCAARGGGKVGTAGNVRWRRRPPRLLEPDADGERIDRRRSTRSSIRSIWKNETNPRWIAKPAVAYLWARTVRCGGCRAEIPLLKTRWLCRKAKKRVRLTLERRTDGSGVDFGIERDVPEGSGNAAQKREHDRVLGAGTMSANGAQVSRVRRDRDDEGHPRGGTGGTARGTHDGRRRGRPDRQGVPPADRRGARRGTRGAGRDRSALRWCPVRPAGRIHRGGAAVPQLARSVRAPALRVRHVAHALHGPAASGARHVRPGDPRLRRRDARLPRRVARGHRRLAGAFD